MVSQQPLVVSVMEGFQRILAKPKVKKEPITPAILQGIVASISQNVSLTGLRLAAICLLALRCFSSFR